MEPQVLGNGWVAAPDPSSGRTYYANTITGQTSWEYPAELLGTAAAPAAAEPAAAAPETQAVAATPEGMPPDWVAAADPSSGRVYYVHLPTGTTQWEPPTGASPAAAAAVVAAAATPVVEAAAAVAVTPAVVEAPAVVAAPAPAPPVPEPAPAPPAPPAPPAAPALELSPAVKEQWRKIVDYARQEATSKIQAKNKKFAGLRNFAEIAAKKKMEAAARKAAAAAEEAAVDQALAAASGSARAKRSLLSTLEVEAPHARIVNIEEFAEEAFELNRKGMFNRKTTVDKILSWKNEVIGKALLKMPSKDLESQAIQCFRNITGFMGDRNTNKEDSGHAEKLLKTCLHAPAELRDEVFCQIIKQTTRNPSPQSTVKGWMLLAIIAGALAPSRDFEPYLQSHCETHRNEPGDIGRYAAYAMGHLRKTMELGPRREVPTAMEIDACKALSPVVVRVFHLDGSFESMPVTSWVTPPVLKAMLCQKLGIKNPDAFGIFEMTPDGEERVLESDERILDLVAYWQRLYEEEKAKGEDGSAKKKKKKAMGNDFYRMVFKVAYYFDVPADDTAALHEMYVQAVYDVVSARYPCGERDCVYLGALQYQAEAGDGGWPDLPTKLARYLPTKYVEGPKAAELAKELARLHGVHAGKTRQDVEAEYLAYVKGWQVYGSSFFFVEPQMNSELPEEVFLAVNPKAILVINPDTKQVLATHPYGEVPTWGYSGSSFVLHIGNLIRQTKLYFATEQGKEINDLVRAYVNNLCMVGAA